MRSVSSDKMPLPNAPVVLNFLDGRVVMWTWFRTTEVSGSSARKDSHVFHMLDFIARCGDGHGPVHLLLVSAVERSVGE